MNVLYEEVGKVAYVTINRPEKRNALSKDVLEGLCNAISKAEKSDVKVVVLKGVGKCFSAGHDLKEIAEGGEEEIRECFELCYTLMRKIRLLLKPVIAQVHGYAVAAGCQLVAACDMAIAAENTKFAIPGVKIGLFCFTPLALLSRNINRKKAFEMAFTGEMIDAKEAEKLGLVNKVVPEEELEKVVKETAEKIASYSREVLENGKKFFYRQYCMNEFDALLYGVDMIVKMSKSDSAREGILAFLEKRKPVWKD